MLERSAAPVYVCKDMIFNQLSDLTTSPGILAVVQQPVWDQETVFKRPRVLGFYGECLQDPANVGAIIRTAVAFGMDALWLSTDSADVFNPKVVRATAGALLRLPVFSVRGVSEFRKRRCTILASEPPGNTSRPIRDITRLPSRAVIALGNESRGLSDHDAQGGVPPISHSREPTHRLAECGRLSRDRRVLLQHPVPKRIGRQMIVRKEVVN